jgi:monoamine oxidase
LKSETEFDVIVVGAGAAGLAALQSLDRAAMHVILLEARSRIGGRICTVHDELSPLPLELGAEFVHGRPAEILDVIRDARLAVYDGTDESRYMNNGVASQNADAWLLMDSVIRDMKHAAQGEDESFQKFLNGTAFDAATRQAALGYIEGFNAAEADVISIQALAEEMEAADAIDGDRVFRFAGGYDAVPLHLLMTVPHYESKLRLNTVVERVEWARGSVCVSTRNGLTGLGQQWRARRVVITVPLGVLQAGSIEFLPEPKEILQAARELRIGHAYRVVLRFREAFWESQEELKDAGFILSSEEFFPTWWTTLAVRAPILTGWSAGAHANSLQGLKQEEILEKALTSLARILGFPEHSVRSQLAAIYCHDWCADEFARGAYSYVPAGGLWARKQIAVPVSDTLYFAGEATDQGGHSATVHGAIASGRRAARQILSIASAPSNG